MYKLLTTKCLWDLLFFGFCNVVAGEHDLFRAAFIAPEKVLNSQI